ncbi:hypothetical protein DUGA2_63840 [Duganella sp. HH101]|nr:hypothetical protein DUGA2_63840 [Duganella sp. HH101]
MDPRQNWATVARGGQLSQNPDGPDFPAGVLDDGEEYTKQIYTEGDKSFPVVQTARGVYAYPGSAVAPIASVEVVGQRLTLEQRLDADVADQIAVNSNRLDQNLQAFVQNLQANPAEFEIQPNTSTYAQTAGGGAVSSWDTYQRIQYKAGIAQNAASGVAAVQAARAANDLTAARAAAYSASEGRIDLREATRAKQSWGGGIVSKGIDKSMTPAQYEAKYQRSNPFDTYELMAEKSGAGRASLNKLVTFGKIAGPAAMLYGGYSAYSAVSNAPTGMKGQVAAQETGGFFGGAVGSTLGTGIGAGAVVIGAGFLGLAAAPAALVIGAGILGGMALGYGGAESGRWVGGKIYQWFQ